MWGIERLRHVLSVRVAVAGRTSLSVVVARARQTVSCSRMHRHSAPRAATTPLCPQAPALNPAELALHIPSLFLPQFQRYHGHRWRVVHFRHCASPPVHNPRGGAVIKMRRPSSFSRRRLSGGSSHTKVELQGYQACHQSSGREVLVGNLMPVSQGGVANLTSESLTPQKTIPCIAFQETQPDHKGSE
jgi:hypothetical protein